MNKDKLIQDRDAILRWMDANDSHMSLLANVDLRALNQQISEIEKHHKTKSK